MEEIKKFKNLEEYKQYLVNNPLWDIVQIGKNIFTMDYYDLDGKEISYGNKKHKVGFYIYTENRYKSKEDAEFEYCENGFPIRNDISYYE